MHFDAYVANLTLLSDLYESMAFINPIEPIDNKSSLSSLVFSNFLTIWATSLKLCSINISLAFSSPSLNYFKYFSSSSLDKTSGKLLDSILPSRGSINKPNKLIIFITPNIYFYRLLIDFFV